MHVTIIVTRYTGPMSIRLWAVCGSAGVNIRVIIHIQYTSRHFRTGPIIHNKHFEPVLVCCGFFLTVR